MSGKWQRKEKKEKERILHHLGIEDLVLVKDHLHHLLINLAQGTRGIKLYASGLFLLCKNKQEWSESPTQQL